MKNKAAPLYLVVIMCMVALFTSCKQKKDFYGFQQWGRDTSAYSPRNDAADYEGQLLIGEGIFNCKKKQPFATTCEIVMGSGTGKKARMGKVTKIDTTDSHVTKIDRMTVLDWSIDVPHGEYTLWHDSIVKFKGTKVGKFQLRLLDSLPALEPNGALIAQADTTPLNLFPDRQRLDSLTFADTLWRTSGFAIDRRWAGKGFSRLAISQERLDRHYRNYQLWGQTKVGTLLSFDYILDPLTNALRLKPSDRLAFSRSTTEAPVMVKVRHLDRRTNTERDTLEEFCCFYVLVEPTPGPWTVKSTDLMISVDSTARAYVIEFPFDKLPDVSKRDWMLSATMYDGDSDIGHPHHLERIEDRRVYRTTFPQSDLFRDENLWFVHGTQASDMQAFESLTVVAEECD